MYWIPLFQILEERGFKVYLVNAHSLKTVPGRKSDVSDCKWIQYLHSVGLLKASFRPAEDICAVRTLWRHRGSLLQMAAEHTQHIQKSLSLMNLQLHHVLSDITGASGLAILDAILAGNRDMSIDFAMPPLLPSGLGSVRINESAAVKCSPPRHGR